MLVFVCTIINTSTLLPVDANIFQILYMSSPPPPKKKSKKKNQTKLNKVSRFYNKQTTTKNDNNLSSLYAAKSATSDGRHQRPRGSN